MTVLQTPPPASPPRPVREQTRARQPDRTGVVDSGGIEIAWEVHGRREPTVLFAPTWSIVHSRIWKLQVPYFARHARVVTFDPRGNGRSGRPNTPEGFDESAFAADIPAVMDATGTDRAVLVSLSLGAQRALLAAVEHPERIRGAVFIAPSLPLAPPHPERVAYPVDQPAPTDDGWAKYNIHYWRREYTDFLQFFFGHCFSEPHSTKPIEDAVGWGEEIGPEQLILSQFGRRIRPIERASELAREVRCPVLVIHGDGDEVIPHAVGAELARLTSGRLVTIAGGGHLPNVRDPVLVNLLIRDFIRSLQPAEGQR